MCLARSNVTEEKELGEKYEIKGFPTLKWFVDGEMALDYSGGRTAPEIVAWIKKKTGPPSTIVDSAEALEKAKKDEVSMFGYFGKLRVMSMPHSRPLPPRQRTPLSTRSPMPLSPRPWASPLPPLSQLAATTLALTLRLLFPPATKP